MSIFDRPIAVAFFALSLITIFVPIIKKLKDEIKRSKNSGADA